MSTDLNGNGYQISLPKSIVDGDHDTTVQRQYINDLSNLSNLNRIPAVVVGVARYVVQESAHRDILFLLPLVTNNFWKAVTNHFEPFTWRVHHPDDVREESKDFQTQTRLVLKLIFELGATGWFDTGKTGKMRCDNASAIIKQMSRLRKMLDENTGFNAGDEYTGLCAPSPWEILENTAIQFAHQLVPQPEGTPYTRFIGLNQHDHEIASRVTLQDVLAATERRLLTRTPEDSSEQKKGKTRHRRFAHRLKRWFNEVLIESGEHTETEDDNPTPKLAITDTTSAILIKMYPNRPELVKRRPFEEPPR